MVAAADWLRADLAHDLDVIQSRTTADWARVGVDTVLMPGLVFRAMVHSCVYAINYAEPGAEVSCSVFDRPLDAAAWGVGDDVQATVLGVIIWGLVAEFSTMPGRPLLVAGVIVSSLAILLDPVLLVASSRGGGA